MNFKNLFLILICSALWGCNRDNRGAPATSTELSSAGTAQCSPFNDENFGLKGQINFYQDTMGQIFYDTLSFEISYIHPSFMEQGRFRFYQWSAEGTTDANTEIFMDQTPLDFRVEVLNTFGAPVPISGILQEFSLNSLQQMLQNQGFFADVIDAFTVMRFVMDAETHSPHNVLQLANTSNQIQLNVLKPGFETNPEIFHQSWPPLIDRLHPLWGQNPGNITSSTFCNGL